ncbi:MAG: aldehyde dehydrogenase family protein [Actinomycetota bacterium]
MDQDLRSIQQARDLAIKAKAAADEWATATQEDVDRAVEAMSMAGRAAAKELAELAVKVTGYGRSDHKEIKDLFNVVDLYDAIAPLRTVGVISAQRETGVVEIAEPVGVIAALIPTTNPVSTVFFKGLISIKARNAVVMAPHPRAAGASAAAAQVLVEALRSVGAPDGLLSCMTEISLDGTHALWNHDAVSMVLATGSAAMVRAAHSSGKPTYAVGPGNVPSYIHASVTDLHDAAAGTLASGVFDYGTPCASEQSVIVDRAIEHALRDRLEALGARFLSDDEAERLTKAVFTPSLTFNPDCVGQSPQALAERAGITVDPQTTALVVRPEGVGRDHPLSMELLTSTLKWYVESGPDEGIARANQLLRFGGEGHTAAVWAGDERVSGRFGVMARAFRVLVNTPACFGAMGATAALPPSFMLGTGTWGGSITADNIGPLHLINRKRVAQGIRDWRELMEVAAGRLPTQPSPLVASTTRDPREVVEDLVHRVLQRLGEPAGTSA